MINGIIIQKKEQKVYQGVDGNNWYLNDIYQDTLGEYFDEKIDKSWYDSAHVDVCNEEAFVNNYIKLSQEKCIEFRILLCETERQYPKMEKSFFNAKFIGYDYAYPGGSYYSAVLNDVYSGRIEEFKLLKLNAHGLFNDLEEVNEFIDKRNHLMKKSENYLVEKGDFIIYKLYEVDIKEFK